MRNILNVIFDILTLVAVVIAGVGHMLPWFRSDLSGPRFGAVIHLDPIAGAEAEKRRIEAEGQARRALAMDLMRYQAWHAVPSGSALGALALLVALSLLISWGPVMRRLLVLLMFLSTLTSILFITLSVTHYPITEWHERFAGMLRMDAGFAVALAPTCFAAAFCLIRMIWTMPPARAQAGEALETPQAVPAEEAPGAS